MPLHRVTAKAFFVVPPGIEPGTETHENSLSYDEILSALSALQTLSQRRNITIRIQALQHLWRARWSSLCIR